MSISRISVEELLVQEARITNRLSPVDTNSANWVPPVIVCGVIVIMVIVAVRLSIGYPLRQNYPNHNQRK